MLLFLQEEGTKIAAEKALQALQQAASQ